MGAHAMSPSELTRILEAETLAQDRAEQRVTFRLWDYWITLRGGQQCPSRANFRMEAVTGLRRRIARERGLHQSL